MNRPMGRAARRGGRIAVLAATAALTLALPLGSAATTASPREPAPSAARPEGPIESSLSVAGTGAMAAGATVMIVRRHQRRSRNSRR
ncbi:hypothetical protein [Streptomyces sp. NPDC001985]|uniref:hypothetical protein n=1 Tax=Streptomyces sp. NPDC001985 TaxID=3154406 RepID=UPI003327B87B